MSSVVVAHLGGDGRDNSPSAVGRMFQMFGHRLVILLPAIIRALAEETDDVVGVIGVRVKHEPGFRKLPSGRRETVREA